MKRAVIGTGLFVLMLFWGMPFKGRAQEQELIYVAGASDSFPIEFYDSQEKRYKGMIPLLLEEMEEEGPYKFVYLRPGTMDRRGKMLQNVQVELCVGYDMEPAEGVWRGAEFWEGASEVEKNVFFYYTDIADEAFKTYVEGYTAGLTEEELRRLSMEAAAVLPKEPFYMDIAKMVLGGGTAALIICALLLGWKAKRDREIAKAYRFQDTMTGFGNIDKWKVVFKKLVHEENRSKYCVAYMDLNMKQIFRTYGFDETAAMLESISEVLEGQMDKSSTFARFYEVSFVLLLPYYSNEQLNQKLQSIRLAIQEMVRSKEKEYFLTPYFGVYLLRQDDTSMEQPIYYAETTFEYAKEHEQLYAVYSKEVKAVTIETYELERDAVHALAQGELEMYIQPVVRLSDAVITGGETFVRWEHPRRGLLHPDQFLPVFRRGKMMDQMDLYIFECACQFQGSRQKSGKPMIRLYRYFSGWNLFQPDFADKLIQMTQKYELTGEYFAIKIVQAEISEANKALVGNIKLTIHKLREWGFEIYMGEFHINAVFEEFLETGITRLLLNKELVQSDHRNARIIMKSLVSMGHRMGTSMIAEGVESEEQAQRLKEIGCDYAKGSYFYQVISRQEFQLVLDSSLEKISQQEKKKADIHEKVTLDKATHMTHNRKQHKCLKRRWLII